MISLKIKSKFQYIFNLGKIIIIDEMMLGYKNKYCIIWQYKANKSMKWRVKVYMTKSTIKHMWNFDKEDGGSAIRKRIRSSYGYFFISSYLFYERKIYSIGIIIYIYIGIPVDLKDKIINNKILHGPLLWKIHGSRKFCAII